MSIAKEFRQFALRGNVVDLAVGVIIGAAFGKIVDSLVRDVVMPVIAALLGGRVDFSNKFFVLGKVPENYTGPMTFDALSSAGVNVLAWGNFLTVLINFILLAFVIFWMVKAVNTARAKLEAPPPPAAPAATPEDILLLRDIRNLLQQTKPEAETKA